MDAFVRLSEHDNVITLTEDGAAGSVVDGLTLRDDVPQGHKVATQHIADGAPLYKYAQRIGTANGAIEAGSHVHTHNLDFQPVSTAYDFATDAIAPAAPDRVDTFQGYRRANGKVGTRNYIAVLTSVNCSATAARHIAQAFTDAELSAYPNVDGVVAYVHGTGCGMSGRESFEALSRVMHGYAQHPNHAGVLLVGLGCEMLQIDTLLERYGLQSGPLFQAMNIQDCNGLRATVERGVALVRAMLPLANAVERESCPASDLTVALQCGGSDAWSGVTANPALGYAVDLLAAQGGTGVLAETPEIYGAEHLLTRRAVNRDVGEKLLERIRWWEDYTARNGGSLDNNPSPGNKKGGLTTILEKSLGAAAKGGTTQLTGVYQYGEAVTEPGFAFMDSPGYDPVSVTGQIAGGCNLVVFTTGRGSAFGSKPAPCLKVSTNSQLYARQQDDMDIDAGRVLSENLPVETVGREIYARLLEVASGDPSHSEAYGLGDFEFVPWQIGATV
ncbi:MAG: altronate dehydratase family protein [Pseudomonadota bacterium]